MASRVQSAHDRGLGNTVPRWETLRTSTRGRAPVGAGERACRGGPVAAHGQVQGRGAAPHSRGLRIGAAGGGRRRREAAQPQPGTVATPPLPPPRRCRDRPTRSTKKKPKKHIEALLAERGKMRGARSTYYATDASACMLKLGSKDEWKSTCGGDQAVRRGRARVLGHHQRHPAGARVRRVRGHRRPLQLLTHLVAPASKVPVRALREHGRRRGERRVLGQTGQVPRVRPPAVPASASRRTLPPKETVGCADALSCRKLQERVQI